MQDLKLFATVKWIFVSSQLKACILALNMPTSQQEQLEMAHSGRAGAFWSMASLGLAELQPAIQHAVLLITQLHINDGAKHACNLMLFMGHASA